MARLHLHPVGLGLLFLGLIAWVVALAGLAASTKDCMDNTPPEAPKGYCGNSYQLEWWSIWLELFILVPMTLCSFLTAFDRLRSLWLHFLSIATVLLTLTARAFITNSFNVGGINFGNYASDAYNAAAGGSVILCIVNFTLIIILVLGAPQPQTAAPPPAYHMSDMRNLGLGAGGFRSMVGGWNKNANSAAGVGGADPASVTVTSDVGYTMPTQQYTQPGQYQPTNF